MYGGSMYSDSGPCFSCSVSQNVHNLQAGFKILSTKEDASMTSLPFLLKDRQRRNKKLKHSTNRHKLSLTKDFLLTTAKTRVRQKPLHYLNSFPCYRQADLQ